MKASNSFDEIAANVFWYLFQCDELLPCELVRGGFARNIGLHAHGHMERLHNAVELRRTHLQDR